jgi:uncharacterized membrane protein YqiK
MKTLLATVTGGEKHLWEISLLMGAVVVVAVIGLLTILMAYVRTIDQSAVSLWAVTKRMAQNTTGLYQLAGTASILRALRDEALRQNKLLSGGGRR